MEDKNPKSDDTININIGVNQPDYHAIDANVLAETLLGIDELAQEINAKVNGSDVQLSVKILGGFSTGSFDFRAVVDFIGGILPMAQNLVEIFKHVIEYRIFLGGKPPVKIEKIPDKGETNVTNQNGNVNIFQNNVIAVGESPQSVNAIRKIFAPLANNAGQIEISQGDDDFKPLRITKADESMLLESNYADAEGKPEQIIENEVERILLIRKPDFIENSKWQFIFNGQSIYVAMDDKEWLAKFQKGGIFIGPGDALKVKLLVKDYYTPEGQLDQEKFFIKKVLKVIKAPEQLPLS